MLVALLTYSPQSASATMVVTFQEGTDSYVGTEDTQLLGTAFNASSNFGGRPNFRAGAEQAGTDFFPNHGLIRFDVTSLATQFPNGFTVNAATLRLTPTAAASFPNNTLDLHLLDDANAGWVEGTSNGVPNAGESTFALRNDPGTAWAGSAGASTAGTDYDASVLASTTAIATTGNGSFALVMGGDLSFFNTWAAGGTNAGFLLKMSNEAVEDKITFFSRNFANSGGRPELILDVTAIPEPTSFAFASIAVSTTVMMSRRRRR